MEEIKQYPKALYRGGEAYNEEGRGVGHQHVRIVNDADEESAARDEGFEEAKLPEPKEAQEADVDALEPVPLPVGKDGELTAAPTDVSDDETDTTFKPAEVESNAGAYVHADEPATAVADPGPVKTKAD